MEFLTTSEASDYLRLGERKLYELVTVGAIPCSKVTGKWLFPRHELDLWVLSGLARPPGMTAAEPPPKQPPQVIQPADGFASPMQSRSRLVFPEPFGPTMSVGAPRAIVRFR